MMAVERCTLIYHEDTEIISSAMTLEKELNLRGDNDAWLLPGGMVLVRVSLVGTRRRA